MRLHALMLAAASLAAFGSAQAQTTTNTTTTRTTSTPQATTSTSTSTTTTPPGAMASPPPASVGTAPPAPMGNTTMGNMTGSATAGPMTGAPFQPISAQPGADTISTLQASGEFTTFLKVADATNLTQVIKTQPNLTVLAPTDTAFQALPPAALDLKDPANLQKLQALLTYHLINAKVPPLAGHSATQVTTVANKKVTLDGSSTPVKINDANALQAQVQTANGGVIYPIDKVLSPDYVPPPAAAAEATPATTDQTTTTSTTKKKTTRKKR